MPYARPIQYRGAIFINLIVAAVMVGVVFAMFLPQIIDANVRTSMDREEVVVSKVKSGIATFYARNSKYPNRLDTASLGDVSPENRFFTEVLKNGVANGWFKVSNNYYRLAQNSSYYFYNNKTGDFREY